MHVNYETSEWNIFCKQSIIGIETMNVIYFYGRWNILFMLGMQTIIAAIGRTLYKELQQNSFAPHCKWTSKRNVIILSVKLNILVSTSCLAHLLQ